MKNILTLLLFAAAFAIITQRCNSESNSQAVYAELPPFIWEIPDGLGNVRSGFVQEYHFDFIFQDINTIIRLNGNEGAGMTVEEERSWCRHHAVEFIYLPIGDNPAKYAARIHDLLQKGKTLIHCQYGYDRTGAMVGYHLRQLGFSKEAVIEHNSWQNYLQQKGEAYKPYYETALNLEQ